VRCAIAAVMIAAVSTMAGCGGRTPSTDAANTAAAPETSG
jgi:hypothetical protein